MPHKPFGNRGFAWMLILVWIFFSLPAPGSGSQPCSDFNVPASTISWSEKEQCAFKPNSFCVLRGKYSTDTWFLKLHTQPGHFSSSQTQNMWQQQSFGEREKNKYIYIYTHRRGRAPALAGFVAALLCLRDQNRKEKHDR